MNLLNKAKSIKAIALDLDGTLLNNQHKISAVNKEAVKKSEAKNKKIIIATGRSYKSQFPYAQDLEINGPVVCYNGAAVFHHPSGEKIFEYTLDKKWAPTLIKTARAHDIHLHFFIDEQWYYEKERPEVELYTSRCGFNGTCKNFDDIEDLSCTKAMFIAEPQILKKLHRELHDEVGEDIYMAFSANYFLEIMRKGVSKSKALKETLKKENISMSEVISFGDGMNDLEMIQDTALGYAMNNGAVMLKKATPYLAPDNSDDGVGQILQKLFLNE